MIALKSRAAAFADHPAWKAALQAPVEPETNEDSDVRAPPVLPHDEAILFQIRHVIKRWLRAHLEEQPADVRVEEAFRDIVGIVVVIDVFVMPAMFARPHDDGILESPRAEDEGEEAHRPSRLKSDMREEPMIAEADAEAARGKHRREECELEPVDPKAPEIQRDRGQTERRSADEEGAGGPVDPVTRDIEDRRRPPGRDGVW